MTSGAKHSNYSFDLICGGLVFIEDLAVRYHRWMGSLGELWPSGSESDRTSDYVNGLFLKGESCSRTW